LVLLVTGGGDRLLGRAEVVGVEALECGEHLRVEGVGVDAGGLHRRTTFRSLSRAAMARQPSRPRL
jgi:hypothetical protein